jgi:Membrane-associated phospholipid phosphatase
LGKTNNGQSLGRRFLKWVQIVDGNILSFFERKTNWQVLQPFMKFLSHPPYLREIMVALVVLLLCLGSTQSRWRLLYLMLVILCADQTCNIVKALVKRVRPDGMRNIKGSIWRKLGYYSFPSSHAANTFAAAVLISHWWLYMAIPLYFLAFLISFSRIYLKNHYPSDILAGGFIGLLYGFAVVKVFF